MCLVDIHTQRDRHMRDHSDDSDSNDTNDTLEQRVAALEARNEELESALERQHQGTSVTRRQTLAGLLGGGALLGATGVTSAQPTGIDDSVRTTQSENMRNLSEFETLQAAVDWSDEGTRTVFIDGEYVTNEGTVTLGNRCILQGMGYMHSQITTTSSTSGPIFEYPDGVNTSTQFSGFSVVNDGNTSRGFFKPAVDPSSYTGFLGSMMYWENLQLVDVGGVYPVDLHNAYGVSVSNVYINTKNGSPNGHFRFDNCNACTFRGLKAIYCQSKDKETPAIYIANCMATEFDSPHIEHIITDAAMQIAGGGNVTITNPHIEGNLNQGGSDYYAGIQIGDGGITTGNTNGSTQQTPATIIGGVCHGSPNPLEAVRILNGDEITLIGLKTGNGGNTQRLVNYGGSNNDSREDLTIRPGTLTVFGNNNNEIVNSAQSGNPDIFIMAGKNHYNERNARNQLRKYEIGFVENNTGEHSIVKRDDTGTIRVWDPDRTL